MKLYWPHEENSNPAHTDGRLKSKRFAFLSIEKAVATPTNRFYEILLNILKQYYEDRQKDTSLSLWNERNVCRKKYAEKEEQKEDVK